MRRRTVGWWAAFGHRISGVALALFLPLHFLALGLALEGAGSLDAFLHRPGEELYDLSKDPHELRNVANDPAYRQVVQSMRADMNKFRAETHDPWLPGTSSPFGEH